MDEKYLTSGRLAKMAKVSVRTVRFYDKQNILKPALVNETTGARYYTAEDLVKLQQILLYKYLGFSLDEIKELMVKAEDQNFMVDSLKLQQTLIRDKIDQMRLVQKAIDDTLNLYEQGSEMNWDNMLRIIELTSMENSLNRQYQNASNISARIRLHRLYSVNREGWFPWLFREMQLKSGMKILELGCGNGALWAENLDRIPRGKGTQIILSDISGGMLQDASRALLEERKDAKTEALKKVLSFREFDCKEIPYPEDTFDVVIANHMLFYCGDPGAVAKEIRRVLKDGGCLYASTYGSRHMKEITELVKEFDPRIELAATELYHIFGLNNGTGILEKQFAHVEKRIYEDALVVDKAEPLLEYIMSCHGNQNQYIVDRYQEFKLFVEKKVSRKKGFTITKEAGYIKAM